MVIKKTVIINRAVPGSGKTTISNRIKDILNKFKINIALHSTDEYFMTNNGKYIFEINKLGQYHNKTMEDYQKSLLNDTSIIICDNTNIAPWQTKPYTAMAREYGYQIIFITFNPREIEKHVASQIVTDEKPDAHGVSEEIIVRMIDEYYIYDKLLYKNNKVNALLQLEYSWNEEKLIKEPTGKASEHFDADHVIRILPNEYHEIKHTIGEKLMELINE